MNTKPFEAPLDLTLYLVTDRGLALGRPLDAVVREAVEGGVTVVQIREKDLGTRSFLREALAVKAVTDRFRVPLIVNDRLDVALACGAAGVHLGQDDMDCPTARRLAGDGFIIGVSVSSPGEALRAEADGADYLGVSPVFSTPTKSDAPEPTGLSGLRAIRRAVGIPLVGIGGIHAGNAADIVQAGADGIAVVSAIMAAPDPHDAARRLRAVMGR
jgi:thiamine-phosphate pyrophosphorylase